MDSPVQFVLTSVRHLAVVRFHAKVEDFPNLMGPAFATVAAYLVGAEIPITGPAVAHYVMHGDDFDVSAGFEVAAPVPGDGNVVPFELPATEVATLTHMGGYDTLADAYETLHAGAVQLGRVLQDTTMWEEYWSPPETPAEETKTVICWPALEA